MQFSPQLIGIIDLNHTFHPIEIDGTLKPNPCNKCIICLFQGPKIYYLKW